jgi:serine/threonine-protein kinase
MTWAVAGTWDHGGVSSPVGTLLCGRYRLDAVVGSGGMSTVFRAFDTVLERQVAIKRMHRDVAADADQLERFRREARAVAQLNHPHVVGVIDAGEDEEAMPFIVFEFVEGETLKDRIRRSGRLAIPEALAYAIEIARALGAAHERGIVHRDVKPQNVLIDEEGSAKVTDFGIARTIEEDGLTAAGRVLGTTDYVAPEQALGDRVTGQSDLYSLGVVLFEMLTGDVPFHGDNQVAVAMKHVREELPDLQHARPEASAALAALLDRATAKSTAERYADAAAMIADLEEVLAIETARAGQATGEATAVLRTLPGATRRRLPPLLRWRVGLVVALAIAGVATAVVLVVLAARETDRGTSAPPDTPPPPAGEERVRLSAGAADDYDPLGTGGEHGDETRFLVDGDASTYWSTETYRGELGAQKAGVGIVLDARPQVRATRIELRSATPGWTGAVYASRRSVPRTFPSEGWTRLATVRDARARERLDLATKGRAFRYYLVWITDLPDDADRAELSEALLFAPERR